MSPSGDLAGVMSGALVGGLRNEKRNAEHFPQPVQVFLQVGESNEESTGEGSG